MTEHNPLLCGGELNATNFPPHYHTILAINCVHASNWFTHLQQTRQIGGENDNSVLNMHACRIPARGLSFSLSKAYIKQVNRFQSWGEAEREEQSSLITELMLLLTWCYYWPGLVCSNVLLKCITVVYPTVYTGIKICPNSPEFTGEAPIFAICWY